MLSYILAWLMIMGGVWMKPDGLARIQIMASMATPELIMEGLMWWWMWGCKGQQGQGPTEG